MMKTKYKKVMEILDSEIFKEQNKFDSTIILNSEEYEKSLEDRDDKLIEAGANIMKRSIYRLEALWDLKRRIEREIK